MSNSIDILGREAEGCVQERKIYFRLILKKPVWTSVSIWLCYQLKQEHRIQRMFLHSPCTHEIMITLIIHTNLPKFGPINIAL